MLAAYSCMYRVETISKKKIENNKPKRAHLKKSLKYRFRGGMMWKNTVASSNEQRCVHINRKILFVSYTY